MMGAWLVRLSDIHWSGNSWWLATSLAIPTCSSYSPVPTSYAPCPTRPLCFAIGPLFQCFAHASSLLLSLLSLVIFMCAILLHAMLPFRSLFKNPFPIAQCLSNTFLFVCLLSIVLTQLVSWPHSPVAHRNLLLKLWTERTPLALTFCQSNYDLCLSNLPLLPRELE